ncbi:MAG: methyltransferase [Verrucomicrobiaceae bacterium]|nr:methyltransferase [Verrucomicrobiaceae bacterium]
MIDISASNYGFLSAEASHMHKYFVPPILRRLASLPGAKVLDLGCGNGALCGSISKAGFEITGVDVSDEGIMHARKAWPGIRFEKLGVYDEPPAEFLEAFDVVISTEVIEHLYAPRALATLISRLLKPGGTAMITTPYHGYWKNLVMAVFDKWDSHHNVFWDHGHIKFWSPKTLRKLFEEEKFLYEDFEGLGRFPYLWMTMLMCFSKPKA